MNGYDLIRSANWEISLPGDWQQVEKPTGEMYFESADGDKGLYIATWNIGEGAGHSSETVVQSFRHAERASLVQMADYEWDLLCDETMFVEGSCVAMLDAVDRERGYRIASKIIARVPVVVRAAFHDYGCEDLEASQSYFAAIIQSLKIHAA